MALDSLALAVLMGFLSDYGDSMSDRWRDWILDSVTITVTLEMDQMPLADTMAFVTTEDQEYLHIGDVATRNQGLTMTSPDQVSASSIAWGINSFYRESLGSIAVHEMAGPAGWRFRTTVAQPLNSRREEEIRWTLTHGIL